MRGRSAAGFGFLISIARNDSKATSVVPFGQGSSPPILFLSIFNLT
jgi:hypothetical protein